MDKRIENLSNQELADAIRFCLSIDSLDSCGGCPAKKLGPVCHETLMAHAADRLAAGETLRKADQSQERMDSRGGGEDNA